MSRDRGYDRNYGIETDRTDSRILVRFDTHRGDLQRFAVQLQHRETYFADDWVTIAQFDHDPSNPSGHDVYEEGLHIDVVRDDSNTETLRLRHGPLPSSQGAALRICADYLEDHIGYFLKVFHGEISPSDTSPWS